MSKTYLRKTITEEELFKEIPGESKLAQMKSTTKRFKFFIETEYRKKPEVVLTDLRKDFAKSGDPAPIQRVVRKFFWEHCTKDQPNLLIISINFDTITFFEICSKARL